MGGMPVRTLLQLAKLHVDVGRRVAKFACALSGSMFSKSPACFQIISGLLGAVLANLHVALERRLSQIVGALMGDMFRNSAMDDMVFASGVCSAFSGIRVPNLLAPCRVACSEAVPWM